MVDLQKSIGYESLKSQYLKQFPSLMTENFSNMEEAEAGNEDEEIVPTNPIERRDAKIAELEKNVAEMNQLQESVLKMKAQLNLAKKTSNISKSKLKFARKVAEERLKECFPSASFEDDDSKMLVTLMSSLIDEDSYERDPDTDTLKAKDGFLKDIEDSFETHSDGQMIKERIETVKNKVLDRVKEKAARSRERKLSISSISSISSIERKRINSEEPMNEKDSVRSKTSSTSNLF